MSRLKCIVAMLTLTTSVMVGCSTTDSDYDAATADTGTDIDENLPDGVTLFECDNPGEACNAHNQCAIDPVCGDDGLCRPKAYQKCDDKLSCTEDICEGAGKCSHKPKEGTCALAVPKTEGKGTEIKCFAAEDRHPDPKQGCKICNPNPEDEDGNQYKWSKANGGSCNDGDDCTKDDYCVEGVCKGTFYGDQCQDKFSCTEDLCDGKGACLGNPLKSNACLINGECYQEKQTDANGCNVCDPATSQNSWTALTEHCLINGTCYQPQDTDPTNCSICDPQKSTTSWTPLPGLCKIDNACYNKGDKNTSQGGCAECDPAVDATAWVVKGDNCYINEKCFDPGDTDSTGCGECVPATDKADWTTISDKCLINGLCHKPGEEDPTKCGECDPVLDANAWSIKKDVCLIADACYQPGDKDGTGCGECVPATSKTSFTPLTDKCLIGLNCFEDQGKDSTACLMCSFAVKPSAWVGSGTTKVVNHDWETGNLQTWVADNSSTISGWNVTNKRAAGGTYSLYYGDPVAGDYSGGGFQNSGTATSPEITLGAAAKAGLRFWLYIDTEAGANYDTLDVEVVEGTTSKKVWQKNITQTVTMQAWQEVVIDLSSYKGKAIKIRFRFDTTDSVSNDGEGAYIDDLTIYHDCP